jgi:hypothetical protein
MQELGYADGVTQLKPFTNAYRAQEPEPMVQFETALGKQMQADFTHLRRGRHPLLEFASRSNP